MSFQQDLGYLRNAISHAGERTTILNDLMTVDANTTESRNLSVQRTPWGALYMPMTDGGIANRWQIGESATDRPFWQGDDGRTLSRQQIIDKLKRMSVAEIDKQLSPIEKYDILRGDYEFKATKKEFRLRSPLINPQGWEGFCNGARCAGINVAEPVNETERTNRQGITVRFQPADLKALHMLNYFYVEKYAMIGLPTRSRNVEFDKRPNPGVVDLTVRSHIGKMDRGFVFDTHLGTELWNEAFLGYERTVGERVAITQGDRAADRQMPRGAKYRVPVNLDVSYLGEMGLERSNRPTQAAIHGGENVSRETWQYDLYLDRHGRIIGGKWTGNGPDMIWFASGKGAIGSERIAGRDANRYIRHEVLMDLNRTASGPVVHRCGRILRVSRW